MNSFYTSEIIVLPQQGAAYTSEELQAASKTHISSIIPGVATQNISFYNQELEQFSIDTIRSLIAAAAYSSHQPRVFVLLNFDTAASEAQNAALKIIEESPPQTLILLVVTRIDQILETITSRCRIRYTPHTNPDTQQPEHTVAWPHSYAQAITQAAAYKDREQAKSLIYNLLTTQHNHRELLLETYQALENNQIVQLTLEHCFFRQVTADQQAHKRQ